MKQNYLIDNISIIMKWRRYIIRNVIIITIIAAIISFIVEKKYTATATILPPNTQQDAMLGMMFGLSASSSTGMSSLAKLGGIVPGISTPSDLYAAIMGSSRIKGEIIKKYNLKKEFKAKTFTDADKALGDMTKIEVSPDGIISVSVTYKNRLLATNIANSFVEELDKFNTETAMTVGKKYRIFVEKRLKDTFDSLNRSEESLKAFQEKNRTVDLEDEIKAAIETVAKLKGEIILKEVQKGAIESSSNTTNPYLQNIELELSELRRQLSNIEFGGTSVKPKEFGAGYSMPFSKLPALALEYARLVRDVKIQSVIFELLTQQYEQAKIMELKDTPTIQFLGKAGVPEKRSSPKRMLIVIFAFVLGIFVNIPLVFVLEYWGSVKKEPEKHTFVIKFAHDVKTDWMDLKQSLLKLFNRKRH